MSTEFHQQVAARFQQSMAVPEAFFTAEADQIARACWAMARRFHQGGRLIAFGNGAWASDAQHVAVEFVHPVIVGKRALPALALTNDSALLRDLPLKGKGSPFVRQLRLLARPQDMALGFFSLDNGRDANVLAALAEAQHMGLLTLGCTSAGQEVAASNGVSWNDVSLGDQGARAGLDFCFTVASADPMVVQETHETLYHVLWELVHIFFEHEGLLV